MNRYIDHRDISSRHMSPLSMACGGAPESEKRILHEMLVTGPQTVYGLHSSLDMSISTVSSAVGRLEKDQSVVVTEETRESGRNKVYYGLTLRGLSRAIGPLYAHDDRATAKALIARGFETWSSLCPEFFGHWRGLTDDSMRPNSSDYWFAFVSLLLEYWYDDGFVKQLSDSWNCSSFGTIYSIGAVIYHLMISEEFPYGPAVDALREIPDVWDQASYALCKYRDRMQAAVNEMDDFL